MNSLDSKRQHLQSITSQLIQTLLERKKTVAEIQTLKDHTSAPWPHFDSEREKYLFKMWQKELQQFSELELLALSLIWEDQAGSAQKKYPAWSERIHLEVSTGQKFEMINPLMLACARPEILSDLKFTSLIKSLL